MSINRWSYLKWEGRSLQGRDEYTTYSGFTSEEDVKEFDKYQRANWYVYFPKITKTWEEDGKWFCILRTAQSCD